MERLKVAVVGVGHLGRHHARILNGLEGVELVGVADLRLDQARRVAEPLGVPAFDDYRALLDRVDAVSIAVPTSMHHQIASPFLDRGVATMIEKPLANASDEGRDLVERAKRNGLVLAVGHIEEFNPAWEAARSCCPKPRYIDVERQGIYTFRSTDIGVVLDLMIHDIELVLRLVDSTVSSITSLGGSVFGGHEDLAQARIEFRNGCIVDLSASRASYEPVRKMRVWGTEGYASIDFGAKSATVVRPSEELRRGVLDLEQVDLSRTDAIRDHLFGTVLQVERIEPVAEEDQLTAELRDFVDAVQSHRAPRVSGEAALAALQVAEQILGSLQNTRFDAGETLPAAPHFRPTVPTERGATPHSNKFRIHRQNLTHAQSPDHS